MSNNIVGSIGFLEIGRIIIWWTVIIEHCHSTPREACLIELHDNGKIFTL